MLTIVQKKYMKKFHTAFRAEYAYALLVENNESKANKVKAQFEKCTKNHPYPGEIQAERELMEIAKNKAYT